MGRKRKADAHELPRKHFLCMEESKRQSNGCSETTLSKEKTDNSNATGTTNVANGNSVKKISNKKDSKVMELMVRRSERINSSGLLSGNRKPCPIVQHVILVENGKEEALNSDQVNTTPVTKEKDSEREPQAQQASTPEMNEISLEDKVDYLINTVDEFKSKFVRQAFERTNEGPSEFSYKKMYFELQKKIEALVEEHYDLVRKLEFARGKIEAYESMKDALIAQKEVTLVSTSKATEPTANKSPQPAPTCTSPPPPSPPPPPPAATILDASKDPKRKKVTGRIRARVG